MSDQEAYTTEQFLITSFMPCPKFEGKKAIERNKNELFAILLKAVCLADIHAFLCEEKNCIHNEMNQVMAISTQT